MDLTRALRSPQSSRGLGSKGVIRHQMPQPRPAGALGSHGQGRIFEGPRGYRLGRGQTWVLFWYLPGRQFPSACASWVAMEASGHLCAKPWPLPHTAPGGSGHHGLWIPVREAGSQGVEGG